MKEETKKYLIIGGGFVVAIAVGIVVYKKYEAGANASQAAADQSTQDELAYLEAQGANNAYAGVAGGGFTVAAPSGPTGTSLAQEIQALESAFGFGAPAASASPPAAAPASSSASPSGAPAAAGSSAATVHVLPVPPNQRGGGFDWHGVMDEAPVSLRHEGVMVA